jgi:hypothetical protein
VALGGPLELEAQASVGGDREDLLWFFAPGQREPTWRGLLVNMGITIGLVLIGFVILRTRRVQVMASSVRNRLGWTALAGGSALAMVSLLFVVFARLGDVGEILSWALSGVFVLTAVAGIVGLSYRLGSVTRRVSTASGAAFVGALLIALLQAIPIFGFVVFLAATILGLGCAVLSGFGQAPEWILDIVRRPPKVTATSEVPNGPPTRDSL